MKKYTTPQITLVLLPATPLLAGSGDSDTRKLEYSDEFYTNDPNDPDDEIL